MNHIIKELDLIVTITDRERSEAFTELYNNEGMPLVLTALGHGTATRETLDYFGLDQTEKAVMFSVSSREKLNKIIKRVKRELYIDIPGNGIVLAVPINTVGGGHTLRFLTHCDDQDGGVCDTMVKETDYELIIAITNEGCNDAVMEAAHSANASGGTVIHAKGTGLEHVQKFFGLSIADERELVFIVAKANNKFNIMKAIMEQAGMASDAKSIVFSLPITSVVGLRESDVEPE